MTQHSHPLVRTHAFGSYRVVPDDNQDGGIDWMVEADLRDPETGRTATFSGSLACATWNGTFSQPWEREIPASTMQRIEALADRLAKAGLY